MEMDVCLQAEHALTEQEKKDFLDAFPSQRGAHVADLIDMLSETDSHLDVIEPMYERNEEVIKTIGVQWFRPAVYACLHAHARTKEQLLFTEHVQPVMQRMATYEVQNAEAF